MSLRIRPVAAQRGSTLLDAMIAILIFSIGILGVVRLQSVAVNLSSDAKYRSDAAMLSDRVIAQMWTAAPATLATDYTGAGGSGGSRYVAWNNQVAQLPNGAGAIAVAADGNVTVRVQWRQPSEAVANVHTYVTATQIAR
ncbi:type IV pilus assembly protein PilV [Tahibacter aquaticus]|uniref:Type IV pilus assembly protein PilV n=1 Tax=Tahibacter aquaticus TaxID=520092 RepID=A0A4R6Z9I4_9GAMM|nr:hypothetical protein [Tahibacter aquaticus]TDR48563.1 type IV pilus assembly protein PilV [Tahibacter aquaticus]